MGTIQPARFLSHTGEILPGVRRVVLVANPAAGSDWKVSVPAGVQWQILQGVATLTTSAAVGNRIPAASLTVDDVDLYGIVGVVGRAASTVSKWLLTSDELTGYVVAYNAQPSIIFPSCLLPQGAVIASSTSGLDVADQWSAISLWVEEYYFTDAQLSEIERDKETVMRQIAQAEIANAQTGGGY